MKNRKSPQELVVFQWICLGKLFGPKTFYFKPSCQRYQDSRICRLREIRDWYSEKKKETLRTFSVRFSIQIVFLLHVLVFDARNAFLGGKFMKVMKFAPVTQKICCIHCTCIQDVGVFRKNLFFSFSKVFLLVFFGVDGNL